MGGAVRSCGPKSTTIIKEGGRDGQMEMDSAYGITGGFRLYPPHPHTHTHTFFCSCFSVYPL